MGFQQLLLTTNFLMWIKRYSTTQYKIIVHWTGIEPATIGTPAEYATHSATRRRSKWQEQNNKIEQKFTSMIIIITYYIIKLAKLINLFDEI